MDLPLLYAFILVAAAGVIIVALRRNADLKRQNEELVRQLAGIERLKRDFISHVSHELKAPLASMQETTHLILERIPGPISEKQQRLLELNLQCGKRLAGMIGNILDFSRLEAGIVEYEMGCQDIAGLVQEVIVQLKLQAPDRAVRIVTDIPPEPLVVECDSRHMTQVFANLVQNALSFTPGNAFVTIQVKPELNLPARMPQPSRNVISSSAENPGYALISISDAGPGIEDAHKKKVFEAFHQVKQGKKVPGQSLGLGLAIARAVVEDHHGAIWVEDNPTGGSIFCVLLPKAAKQAELMKQVS